jgi:hypothetical protein
MSSEMDVRSHHVTARDNAEIYHLDACVLC